jgi:hypothetical membrane protein
VSNVVKWGRWAAALVPVSLVVAVAGFGAALPGYSQWRHPVALLGATGIPHASAFCVLGFVLPGLLAFAAVPGLLAGSRDKLQRIGLQLTMLSGIAFCGLGLFPLDPTDLDGRSSQFHATAWLLWALAFVPGAGMLGLWLRQQPGGRLPGAFCLAAAAALALLSFLPPGPWLPAPLAQRLAFLAWALWWPLASWTWPRARSTAL